MAFVSSLVLVAAGACAAPTAVTSRWPKARALVEKVTVLKETIGFAAFVTGIFTFLSPGRGLFGFLLGVGAALLLVALGVVLAAPAFRRFLPDTKKIALDRARFELMAWETRLGIAALIVGGARLVFVFV